MKKGALFLLVILLVSSFAKEVPTLPIPQEVEEIQGVENVESTRDVFRLIGGILWGAFRRQNSIESCVNDSVSLIQNVNAALGMFKQDTNSGVRQGLVYVGNALELIPNAIRNCKDVGGIIQTITNAVARFKNPMLLVVNAGRNILWHHVDIIGDVRLIIRSLEANPRDYFNVGVGIGGIIEVVFIRNPRFEGDITEKPLQNDGSDFLKGFAHGVSPNTYNDVKTCIDDVSPATWNRIENDIKGLSWKHVKQSIENINDIGKVFEGVLKDCKSSSAAVQHLISQLSHAFDASNFIDAALEIVKHPIKFEEKINRTTKDFKNHKYYAGGDEIRDFVGDVLKLKEEEAIVKTLLKELL
jgi:hypothetical protein